MTALDRTAPTEDRAELGHRVAELARVPVLLVACDYDGTVAPIVENPAAARPNPESVVALRTLAALPDTHVAIVSGRALRDLSLLSRLPSEIHLVGSHGSEFDLGFAGDLAPEVGDLVEQVYDALAAIAARYPGSMLERKPASVAFHYRRLDDEQAERAVDEVMGGPGGFDSVRAVHGKKVVEILAVRTHKGQALDRIRQLVGASAVLYLGDDVTDEDAFAALSGPDLGVRVGVNGPTAASATVTNTDEVARLLAHLCDVRRDWLWGAGAAPIERHSLLSDQRTVALVGPDAAITWFCQPRSDSAAIFSSLLGGSAAGWFRVSAEGGTPPMSQRYVQNTLTLETRWPTFTVTDYLDCSPHDHGQDAERADLVRVISGRGRVEIDFAPRLDYGRVATAFAVVDDGLEVRGSSDAISLHSPGVAWRVERDGNHERAMATVTLDSAPLVLELRCGHNPNDDHPLPEPLRRAATERAWSSWAESLRLPPVGAQLVVRSALTLKALAFAPSGAFLAAATTSLPERIGGVRNWDYRYCWLRDAALTATTIAKLGSPEEGLAFLGWLERLFASLPHPERVKPVYSVNGHHLAAEAVLDHLPGYAGSRPVRIGNAADHQVQLDVFGPIVALVHQLAEGGAKTEASHWQLVQVLCEAVERRWREPDHGIWEIRKPPRHHVYSKVMCWFALDRALDLARLLGEPAPERWKAERDAIAGEVLEEGWKPEVGAFTAAYDGVDLDAAALFIGLSGLLPGDDPRFIGTINAVERELREGPTVYRYRADDGLPGAEGGFNLCASWLVDAYVLADRLDDAWELFNRLRRLVGPTGLMSEQYDPATERALGNHPQAYSHVGLIENALRLSSVTPG